jgi:hypothetical protein
MVIETTREHLLEMPISTFSIKEVKHVFPFHATLRSGVPNAGNGNF